MLPVIRIVKKFHRRDAEEMPSVAEKTIDTRRFSAKSPRLCGEIL